MKSSLLFSFTAFALCLMAPVTMAADKSNKQMPAPKETATKAPAPKETPVTKWIAAENAMIDPLSKANKESIYILRNKHSIIRVIRVVEADIKKAVKSCADANPDMKGTINDRFKQWQGAVGPILDTAQKQLDKDVAAQEIVPAKEFKKVLKLNDAAYKFGEDQIVKQPVSTPEACEDLIKSMDRTEDNMIGLLKETLLTESVIRSRADKAAAPVEKEKSFGREKPKAK